MCAGMARKQYVGRMWLITRCVGEMWSERKKWAKCGHKMNASGLWFGDIGVGGLRQSIPHLGMSTRVENCNSLRGGVENLLTSGMALK